LLGNIRTGRNFELEKREQTYIIEGNNYVQDENRKTIKVRKRKKNRREK
jgi:hypothetical protein